MDVRTASDVTPETVHKGSVLVWWLVNPREMMQVTDGGFLELVSIFEVEAGAEIAPHKHPTHEWYYGLSGDGIMVIEDEERAVGSGDLVYIPPNLIHTLRAGEDGFRGLGFAIAEPGAPEIDYVSD